MKTNKLNSDCVTMTTAAGLKNKYYILFSSSIVYRYSIIFINTLNAFSRNRYYGLRVYFVEKYKYFKPSMSIFTI